MDFNKRTGLGWFKRYKSVSLGETREWDNSPKLSEKMFSGGMNSQ